MEGRQLGRYKLIEEIGQGGMAVVWRGVDTTLQREVAVKILHPHLSRKESNRQRFAREARVVATLHHDNIVEIYDFSGGEANGAAAADAYIVCEYIRGRTLADFVEKVPVIPVEVGVMFVLEICEAVAHAHASGIVHRDIKPENVMIRQDGVLKLMDFGIARVNDDSGATMTGTLMGSPQFMSPEQVAGAELDARSDLFSIGVVLYRLVTGALPFDGPNPASILRAIVETVPVPADVKNPLVGRALAAAIRKALAKNPAERQPSARALQQDLSAAIADAGLGAPREELKRYFADPDAYSGQLRESLIARYSAAGHARVRRRDTAAAMELYSRVLELDPTNAGVKAALDRLGRGQRNTRAAILGGGIVAGVLALGIAGSQARHWMSRPTPAPSPAPTSTTLAGGNDATPSAADSPARPTSTSSATAAPTSTHHPIAGTPAHTAASPSPRTTATATAAASASPTAQPVSTAAPTHTRVAMIPTPQPYPDGQGAFEIAVAVPAAIVIDGKDAGDTMRMKNKPIFLDAGRHTIHLAALAKELGCEPIDGFLDVVAGRTTHEVRTPIGTGRLSRVLRPAPDDSLYLRGCAMPFRIDAGGATAAIDGVWLDGKKIDHDERGWQGRSGNHSLRISAHGFQPLEIPVELKVHQDVETRVTVELTPEKK